MSESGATRPRSPGTLPPGTLYLVPTPLNQDPEGTPDWLAPAEAARVAEVRRFAVETPKVARGWLGRLLPSVPVRLLDIRPLPAGDDPAPSWDPWLAPLLAGESVGLLSDAGCPGIADPGAALVGAAHDAGIPVRPLVGPSAIVLLLMAGGLQGQRFAFHGYLPVAPAEREQAIRALAQRARQRDETQVVIETPYRNQAIADSLIATLPADAILVIGADLTGAGESITRRRVAQWRRQPPTLGRVPASFLFGFETVGRPAKARQAGTADGGPARPGQGTVPAPRGQRPQRAQRAPSRGSRG